MKVAICSTYDTNGGAAIATYRLHKSLQGIGVDSTLLVQRKFSDDRSVMTTPTRFGKVEGLMRPHIDSLPVKCYPKRGRELFSVGFLPDHIASSLDRIKPDIMHMFWVAGGFLRVETLASLRMPIIWGLHDMWPFTGGCHYDDECGRFRENCGRCPLLGSEAENDLSRRRWQHKFNAWRDLPIVVVATSHWIGEMARASSLFANKRIEVIPNNVDVERYKPIDKAVARSIWNLPQSKKLVLFSAFSATSDKRKGHQFLVPALQKLREVFKGEDVELVVIGASEPPANAPELGMKVHYIGRLADEVSQVLLYSAADVTVAPSMQENLSNTVLESLACGTPVVSFNVGGMPDMINHKVNGYLAKPFDADDLSYGIRWVLEDKNRCAHLSQQAREVVLKRYTSEIVARQNLALYEDLIQKK